ncbi:MAG: DUF4091 domain-containing protein [Clostridia bacterium]|nr:DUF4091 domain-containing protein [Clostridia bacterium]
MMAALTLAVLTSSQTKIFPDTSSVPAAEKGYAFADEPHHFQLALRSDTVQFFPVSVQVAADLPVEVYKTGFVPVVHPMAQAGPEGYARTEAGLYPDPLYVRPPCPVVEKAGQIWREADTKQTINLASCHTVPLWITLNPEGEALADGEYPVTVRIVSLTDGTELQTLTYTVRVLPHRLAENRVYYTNWFHCDCLADIYGIEVWSSRFWEILPYWLKNAAKHGMTTLLVPAFTPPLDTPVGHERMNVQLADITADGDGGYSFDLTRLERFLRLAMDCGIRYFEHAHFFSQWGAAHAPNIYARTPEGYRRIFGWETDASGEEYRVFLEAYLTALNALSDRLGIRDRWVFHISDEPSPEHLDNYLKAKALVQPFVGDCPLADAVYFAEYAENGSVHTPVAEIGHADAFAKSCGSDRMDPAGTNAVPLWLYYTGGPSKVTNRMLPHTHARTRVLGAILYRYGASGFLHWGYNFYYDRMSVGLFHPLSDPCAYKDMPGSTYLAYPAPDGKPIPSVREMLMGEAMCDLRALWKAEEILGSDRVLARMEEVFGAPVTCRTIPEGELLLQLRKRLAEELSD